MRERICFEHQIKLGFCQSADVLHAGQCLLQKNTLGAPFCARPMFSSSFRSTSCNPSTIWFVSRIAARPAPTLCVPSQLVARGICLRTCVSNLASCLEENIGRSHCRRMAHALQDHHNPAPLLRQSAWNGFGSEACALRMQKLVLRLSSTRRFRHASHPVSAVLGRHNFNC